MARGLRLTMATRRATDTKKALPSKFPPSSPLEAGHLACTAEDSTPSERIHSASCGTQELKGEGMSATAVLGDLSSSAATSRATLTSAVASGNLGDQPDLIPEELGAPEDIALIPFPTPTDNPNLILTPAPIPYGYSFSCS